MYNHSSAGLLDAEDIRFWAYDAGYISMLRLTPPFGPRVTLVRKTQRHQQHRSVRDGDGYDMHGTVGGSSDGVGGND